ncbi:hypothetical protein [Streptomyces sp. NPDC048603]|uniref:hypothetical protein n=1 Tax=Streptomyces sp. NPDC048603 TaxID=3365577 RepID=UPI003710BBA5
MPTSPTALTGAIRSIWTTLRSDLPELPDAQISVVPTPPPADHGPERWSLIDDRLQNLTISSETVAGGPEEVLTTLLHEAAHVLNWIRGEQDTARRGAYHNGVFEKAAETVGLTRPEGTPRDANRGFVGQILSDEARERHAASVTLLDEIIPAALSSLPPTRTGPKRKNQGRTSAQCKCEPPRTFSIAESTLNLGPIVCGVCKGSFT